VGDDPPRDVLCIDQENRPTEHTAFARHLLGERQLVPSHHHGAHLILGPPEETDEQDSTSDDEQRSQELAGHDAADDRAPGTAPATQLESSWVA
jgi:hypothetical protein